MAEERDFILARLNMASAHARAATEALDNCVDLFLYPLEDKDGSDRSEALDIASSAAGELSRSVEMAQEILESLNKKQLVEEEPEDDDGEEELDSSSGADSPTEE